MSTTPAIIAAAQAGDTAQVVELLAADDDLVNVYSDEGWTPLHLAAFFGHTATVAALLAHGADVNARSRNALDNMPLHAAVADKSNQDHLPLVEQLLAHGAEVNARQHGGFTPLHGSAQLGHADLVRLLLAHGADASLRDDKGRTPAAIAAKAGHSAVADLLRQWDGAVAG